MDEDEKLKKQVDVLEKKLALYEKDATYRGFYALNRIVNQQVDYLNGFNLKEQISKSPKDDKEFDRANSIWKELKGLINNLNDLKSELRINDEEEKERFLKNKITTPESIANVLGNSAGQQD